MSFMRLPSTIVASDLGMRMAQGTTGTGTVRVVVAGDEGDDLLKAVIALGDSERETLGFLPESATREYAARGQVLAAVDDNGLLGFATFGLSYDSVRLIHLCVAPSARGRGVARRLVDAIADRHPDRTEIRLRCRRDFPAHHAWPQLGFTPVGDAVGRSYEGHLLTEWQRPIHHALTLFDHVSSSETDRVAELVVDANVFLDMTLSDRGAVESEALTEPWIQEQVLFLYSDELLREVDRHPDPLARKRARAAALSGFRHLVADPGRLDHCERTIRQHLGPDPTGRRARSDRKQIAYAEAAGADYFVTRDDALLTNVRQWLAEHIAVRIVSPGELVLNLGTLDDEFDYAPAKLLGTSLDTRPVQSRDVAVLGSELVNHAAGEPRTQFTQRIRDLLSDQGQWKGIGIWHYQQPVGLVVWRAGPTVDEVAVLRAKTGWQLSATLARELLASRRRERVRGGGGLVRVTDPNPSRAVEATLRNEGFLTRGDERICRVLSGIGSAQEWETAAMRRLPTSELPDMRAAIRQLGDARADTEFERALWPAKVADSDIATYLVPVKPAFAADLFDDELASQTLLDRPDRAGIARENVYYRSPRGPRMQTPARILWYVTHEPRRAGVKAVRAVSQLDTFTLSPPDRIHRRFARIGAYSLQQVREAAEPKDAPWRDQRVMAIRFSLTERLPQPVALARLREIADSVGHTLVLRSVSRIPATLFDAIYQEGGG